MTMYNKMAGNGLILVASGILMALMRQFVLTVWILIFSCHIFAQAKEAIICEYVPIFQPPINPLTTIQASSKINAYLSALETKGFNGSIFVSKEGEIVLSKGYGYCDLNNKLKNTPATIFDIGSITKQFTASAILRLEMEGKLSVTDKISRYFDNLPADKSQITIHDLLRHQSGLISSVGTDYEKISEQEFLNKVFASELRFPTGSEFSYSNIGYSLLAMIIEKVSRQSYELYLYKKLWKPAGMEMTGYSRPAFPKDLIAVVSHYNGEVWGRPTDKEWSEGTPYWHLTGNGGILSTTGDMYKWHRALLTDKILSKDAKRKLFYPELRAEEHASSYYAYGWDVAMTERKTMRVGHNGTNNIFYADFLRFPEEDIVIILMSNRIHFSMSDINMQISRIIFDPNYRPEIPAVDNDVNRNFTQYIIRTIEENGLDSAKTIFDAKNESAQLLEFVMRNRGFDYIDIGKPETALQIFEMNVYAYPRSAKALQGLGEGYMETGNKELAINYFNESLRINPDNPFVSEMLRRLEE